MENKVLKIFEKQKIEYILYRHKAVFSCEESKNIKQQMKGLHNKSLFLVEKKSGDFYLIILPCEKRMDFSLLSRKLSLPRMSFASEEQLNTVLGVHPGSVTPFGLFNAEKKQVTVVIDSAVTKEDFVSFHPCVNTSTVAIKTADFKTILSIYAKHFYILNL